ncbi:hypothetical protein Q7P37_001707 [Cladosporium fusiforme]
MFYDCNVPWAANDTGVPRTLNFLHELGYNVVALNYAMTGKVPNEISCAIPDPLPYKDLPPKLEIRRRITLTLTDSLQNARLNALAAQYDILALRPVDEKTLQLACGSLDCDIISLDLTQRFPFHFKFKTLSEAIKLGKKIEICYGQGLLGDSQGRRNLISNVTQLIRATRARGLLISSEAKAAVACRGPWDAINLAAVWGLGQEKGYEAMTKEARGAMVGAQLKRTSYRGVVNVVYGGQKPTPEAKNPEVNGKSGKQNGQAAKGQAANGQKRKSDVLGSDTNDSGSGVPLSKTQMKKRAKKEKLDAEAKAGGATAPNKIRLNIAVIFKVEAPSLFEAASSYSAKRLMFMKLRHLKTSHTVTDIWMKLSFTSPL